MAVRVRSVQQPDLAPFVMPDRFRHDVTYFCTPAGQPGAPGKLGEREYFVRREDAERILDDGVLCIVSPLDSASRTEIEITEEQEAWLAWMLSLDIQHVRLE